MKIIPVLIKDEIEAYFVRYKTKNQQIIKIIPKLIEIAKRIPRQTATPFPPLNFNQTGKICPRKHKSADK